MYSTICFEIRKASISYFKKRRALAYQLILNCGGGGFLSVCLHDVKLILISQDRQSVRELTKGTDIRQAFGKEAGTIEQGTL